MKHPIDRRYERSLLKEARRQARKHAVAGNFSHTRGYRARIDTTQMPQGRTEVLQDSTGTFYFIAGYSLVGGTDKAR